MFGDPPDREDRVSWRHEQLGFMRVVRFPKFACLVFESLVGKYFGDVTILHSCIKLPPGKNASDSCRSGLVVRHDPVVDELP